LNRRAAVLRRRLVPRRTEPAMSIGLLLSVILALAALGYVLGRQRAVRSAGGDTRRLHSLTRYHGQSVFLFTAAPALLVVAVWLILQPIIVGHRVGGLLGPADIPAGSSRDLVMSDVRRVADGLALIAATDPAGEAALAALAPDPGALRGRLAEAGVALAGDIPPAVYDAAVAYRQQAGAGRLALSGVAIALALAGLALSAARIRADFRARNVTERFVLVLFILASCVAVLTTFGIFA